MRFLWTGVLLLALMTTGCWDTVTTMRPGETIELETMTFGDDYVVDSCRVTRLSPDGVALLNASSLALFSEARRDRTQAMLIYLNELARVTGLVTDVQDYQTLFADEVEITIEIDDDDNKVVECELRGEFTEGQLNSMLGKSATLQGRIRFIGFNEVWLYDCEIVEVPE